MDVQRYMLRRGFIDQRCESGEGAWSSGMLDSGCREALMFNGRATASAYAF